MLVLLKCYVKVAELCWQAGERLVYFARIRYLLLMAVMPPAMVTVGATPQTVAVMMSMPSLHRLGGCSNEDGEEGGYA